MFNVRKLIIMLVMLSVLFSSTACDDDGEELTAHIDIRDEIIGDSYQVMRIIEKAVEKDERPDIDILLDYADKYLYEDEEFTDEEIELVLITNLMITRIDEYITINSDRRDSYEDKEKWYKTLETGERQ